MKIECEERLVTIINKQNHAVEAHSPTTYSHGGAVFAYSPCKNHSEDAD